MKKTASFHKPALIETEHRLSVEKGAPTSMLNPWFLNQCRMKCLMNLHQATEK
jgi:hypothetical protein